MGPSDSVMTTFNLASSRTLSQQHSRAMPPGLCSYLWSLQPPLSPPELWPQPSPHPPNGGALTDLLDTQGLRSCRSTQKGPRSWHCGDPKGQLCGLARPSYPPYTQGHTPRPPLASGIPIVGCLRVQVAHQAGMAAFLGATPRTSLWLPALWAVRPFGAGSSQLWPK